MRWNIPTCFKICWKWFERYRKYVEINSKLLKLCWNVLKRCVKLVEMSHIQFQQISCIELNMSFNVFKQIPFNIFQLFQRIWGMKYVERCWKQLKYRVGKSLSFNEFHALNWIWVSTYLNKFLSTYFNNFNVFGRWKTLKDVESYWNIGLGNPVFQRIFMHWIEYEFQQYEFQRISINIFQRISTYFNELFQRIWQMKYVERRKNISTYFNHI